MVEAKAERVSAFLDPVMDKDVVLYGAYGAWGVHLRERTTGGVTTLLPLGTLREVSAFLDGMIEGARLMEKS